MLNKSDDIPPTADRGGDTNPARQAKWLDDKALVQRVLAHEGSATAELTRRLALLPAFLRNRNKKLGHPLGDNEIPDLVQDVLVIIWNRLHSFEGRSTIETWACAVASFEMMNAMRRRQRRHERERPLAQEAVQIESNRRDVGALHDLAEAFATLDDSDADVLQLKHHSDLSFREVGDRLGLSTSGAKNRYYKALEDLRRRLTGRRGHSKP